LQGIAKAAALHVQPREDAVCALLCNLAARQRTHKPPFCLRVAAKSCPAAQTAVVSGDATCMTP